MMASSTSVTSLLSTLVFHFYSQVAPYLLISFKEQLESQRGLSVLNSAEAIQKFDLILGIYLQTTLVSYNQAA